MKLPIMCGGCCQREKDVKQDRGVLSNPRRNRGCTDIFVFLVFIFFLCGMIFIGAFSISKGDPFRLVYGTDSFGNTCDEDNTDRAVAGVRNSGRNLKGRHVKSCMSDEDILLSNISVMSYQDLRFAYLFFMNLEEVDTSMRICVNKCPENNLVTPRDLFDFSQQTGSLLCRYDIGLGEYDYTNRSSQGPCPVLPLYKSAPLLNRCIPSDLVHIKDWLKTNVANNIIAYINKSSIFHKALRDLYASWTIIIALCFLAAAFSIFLVLLIRFLASVVAWLIVAFAGMASLVGTSFMWWTFISNKNKLDKEEELKIPLLEVDINSEFAFLTFSVAGSALTVILLLVIVALRKRIALVAYLLKEAGSCVSYMPMLLLQPVWTFILLLMFFVYWVTVLAFLCTAETPSVTELGFVVFKEHETVSYFWWYHLVGLIWVSEFIIACQSFIISGAVARWYFTRDKSQLGFPILGTLGRLILFHQGSVAFGALILTIVKVPRSILIFITKRMKNSENSCGRFCLRCCCCCVLCVDKCLRYLSSNTYTVVAINGKNFCTSAKKGYGVLMGNALRVSAVDGAADFILFLGKVSVMTATTAIGVFWFKSYDELHFYAIPVLLVSILSFFIAHCFLSTYQMILHALLLCFCEDRDLNDGSDERPYFGSSTFMVHVTECSSALNDLLRKKQESNSDPELEPAQV